MQLALDILVTLAAVCIVAQYAWAGKGHFHSDRLSVGPLVVGLAVLAVLVLDLQLLWAIAQPALAQLAGLCIMLAAGAFFWVVVQTTRHAKLRMALDPQGPRSLVRHGPYAFVRHPFYASYIVFWAGVTISIWSSVALIPFAVIVGIYALAAFGEERKFAQSDMAGDYAEYRARTGFLWPRLR